jgi:predicted transcriptional regulator of viral defense system
MYSPSYVSMESALRYYDLIPEWVFMTTACSTKRYTSEHKV